MELQQLSTVEQRHSSRHEKGLIFARPHDKKQKGQLTLNFLSRFLYPASFSTFASRAFLFVEKITNKSRTPFGKLAKELNSTHQTKTRAKKFMPPHTDLSFNNIHS
jgi:hypothetical protein